MQELTEQQMEKVAAVQNLLFLDHELPAFEKACAERGINFPDADSRDAALETVALLRMKEAQLREQGVNPNPTPFTDARDLLKQAMAEDLEALEGATKGNEKKANAGDERKIRLREALEAARATAE